MDSKDKRALFTVVDKDYTTSDPTPFDAEHERLMREELRRRVEQNRQGNFGDVVRGK